MLRIGFLMPVSVSGYPDDYFMEGLIGQVFWNIHKFEPRRRQVTTISYDVVSFRRCGNELFRLDSLIIGIVANPSLPERELSGV